MPPRTSKTLPPPPGGYDNWLEYAIATFDGHRASLNFMFDDEPTTKQEIEAAVIEEFNLLRLRANLPAFDSAGSSRGK
ncbi:hypothetical protein [Variovorax sp. AFSI2.2]|uniref:hypothetical protein n=1 Tax=Variovorax sp. AFSI2.2 TaxID=3384160 RepID=UPI003EB8413C